ncbi:MAG TPA: PqiC family protein [Candidatus Methylomirabilis sp.]|nr:PqiC family protein [Candidatus Methylomirabilis sp.]
MNYQWTVRRLLGLLTLIGVAGCAVSDPTQFYFLAQTATSSSAARSAESRSSATGPRGRAVGTDTVGVGVGPVIMPGYLDRTQIVTRGGPDRVKLATFHRWAEPLENGIARIHADEIGARVPTDRIVTFPWRGVVARAIEYQVVLAVDRFDGTLDGDVTLDTRWRILGRNGDELAFSRSTITETVTGSGYDPMIAAMSRTLVVLGQEIATEIRALPRSR